MNKEIDTNYHGPRKATNAEVERLIKGKYKKFVEGNIDDFLNLFTDCPKPDKGIVKPFEKDYDPEQIWYFKYKNLCYFLTPCEHYQYEVEESKWYLVPIWQYFKSEKYKGCTTGFISILDKMIFPSGLIEKYFNSDTK